MIRYHYMHKITVANPAGAPPPPPLTLDQLFFNPIFLSFIILINKAQIARETIKTTIKLPGREPQNLLRPPPPRPPMTT